MAQLNRDGLLDPRVQQAIRKMDEDALLERLGENWRNQSTSVRSAAQLLQESYEEVVKLLNAEDKITLGAVWDHYQKRWSRPRSKDYDTLRAWSKANNWPLYVQRKSIIRFMRAAQAARLNGFDLGEIKINSLSAPLIKLGTARAWMEARGNYSWWKDRMEKVRVWEPEGWKTGRIIAVWSVADLLDWFLFYSTPNRLSEKPLRALLRNAKRVSERHISADTWTGACVLQRAWNWWGALTAAPFDWRDDTSTNVAHALASALRALAEIDPDWTRPAFDASEIKPDYYYPIRLPDPAARFDIVHTPADAQLLQVLTNGHIAAVTAKFAARKIGIDIRRVAYITGRHIRDAPHAYTW